MSAKQYETPLPDFRKTAYRKKESSVEFAADQLLKLLQSENEPPFAQLRALFRSADPTVNGLDGPQKCVRRDFEWPKSVALLAMGKTSSLDFGPPVIPAITNRNTTGASPAKMMNLAAT